MRFTKDISIYTHEVKQSKFIAHLLPYERYEKTLEELKKEHPKARHFVTAFRFLNEYEQIVEHSSDDGEPKGTSGKPSLMVLQGQEIINTAVIVVRYFGGTKLGTGGLVRAYSDAINHLLESIELYEYKKKIAQTIEIEYTKLRQVEYECEAFCIEIVEKLFDTKILCRVLGDERSMQKFLHKLEREITIL